MFFIRLKLFAIYFLMAFVYVGTLTYLVLKVGEFVKERKETNFLTK